MKFSLLKIVPQYLLLHGLLEALLFTLQCFGLKVVVLLKCAYVLGREGRLEGNYVCQYVSSSWSFFFFFLSWLWDKSRNPPPLEVKELKWAPRTNILLRNPQHIQLSGKVVLVRPLFYRSFPHLFLDIIVIILRTYGGMCAIKKVQVYVKTSKDITCEV